MKIREIQTFVVAVPLRTREARGKPGVKGKVRVVISQLITDEGLDGFGLAFTMSDADAKSIQSGLDSFAQTLVGNDICFSKYALIRDARAASVIDNALWVLKAKALGVPLVRLLGGSRAEVPAYASDCLRDYMSIDELQQEAASLVRQGFRAMKLRMGGKPLKIEVERFKAVREAVGADIDILIDAHWKWTTYDAIRIGRALEQYRPYWIEDPIKGSSMARENLDDLAGVSNTLDVPIAAGEKFTNIHIFRRIMEKRAADIVIVDVQRAGGITKFMKIAAMAEAWNLPIASHLAHDFSAHLIAAIPNGLIVEYQPWWDVIYREPPKVEDGYIKIQDKPGLGLELDLDAIKRYEI